MNIKSTNKRSGKGINDRTINDMQINGQMDISKGSGNINKW